MGASDHAAVVDQTVCDALSRAKIEDYYDIKLKDADPKALSFVVDQSKKAGNEAFRGGQYKEAIRLYSQAIAGSDQDATLFSNRSAAHLGAGLYEEALWDAEKCVQLRPDWAKGLYRLGVAAAALCQWESAHAALEAALRAKPGDAEAAARLREVEWVLTRRRGAREAQAAVQRRAVVARLREVRSAAAREAALRQFKQSMAGPEWELEDLDWRPTFLPSMRAGEAAAAADPARRALVQGYLRQLADLAAPKAALETLADGARWRAYDAALRAAGAGGGGGGALALEAGSGGLLGLVAARALPERSVLSVHRSRMLHRMAKQVVAENRAPNLRLADCVLAKVSVDGEEQGVSGDEQGVHLPSRANLLVTDMFDHGFLGMGLLPALDDAARRLLTPDAVVVPHSIWAQLLEITPSSASGFDLTPLDGYRWWPGAEAVDLSQVPHRPLSAPFLVNTLALQDRVRRVAAGQKLEEGAEGDDEESSAPAWELDEAMRIGVTRAGLCCGVAFWWDAALDASVRLASRSPASLATPDAATSTCLTAVQYLDPFSVAEGAEIALRVRQDQGQILFGTDPPTNRPRHALVPRWHYDMVMDGARNDAYDAAIRRAVARLGPRCPGGVHMIDLGAGTGLLSMMAARAGAASAVGIEQNRHMCDVADDCVARNGLLGRVTILSGDARRARSEPAPDGAPADVERRADLLVYEVFDSGLIGEGVFHILAAAKEQLARRGAVFLPASARVYVQPLQMRVERAAGFDVRQANRWRWRPDYEGVQLERCRERWTALADPVEAFAFDFADAAGNMRPVQRGVELLFTAAGVFNAVALWFELQLDEEEMLSTSPHREGRGPTWQQALFWVPERRVSAGEAFELAVSHDTYAISVGGKGEPGGPDSGVTFSEVVEDADLDDEPPVPLFDPGWKEAYDRLQPLNASLVRACVQSPLEYRATALAAVELAARPHDHGVDAAQAHEFCSRMMG